VLLFRTRFIDISFSGFSKGLFPDIVAQDAFLRKTLSFLPYAVLHAAHIPVC